MEFVEVSAKTVSDAITEACQKFSVTSDKLEYEVVQEGSSGFLGINAKPAIIKAKVKEEEKTIDVKKDEPEKTCQLVLPICVNRVYLAGHQFYLLFTGEIGSVNHTAPPEVSEAHSLFATDQSKMLLMIGFFMTRP